MKTFKVHLRDGKTVSIDAESYQRDGEQYVFVRPDDSEVHFFLASEVVGIVEAPQFGFDPCDPPPDRLAGL